jgi:hypothetical protein
MLKDIIFKNTPKFSIKKPGTNKTVWFRPMLVKEEKKLLILQEMGSKQEIINSISEIIEECFDDIKADSLPTYELDYYFIQLRAKSIGEEINAKFICPETNEKINLNINLNDIQIKGVEKFNTNVKINDALVFTFRAPSYKDLQSLSESNLNYETLIDLTVKCLLSIQKQSEIIDMKGYQKEEIQDLISNMTSKEFDKIIDFFDSIPTYSKEVSYTTSDGINRKITISGIEDFFMLASAI